MGFLILAGQILLAALKLHTSHLGEALIENGSSVGLDDEHCWVWPCSEKLLEQPLPRVPE
jgi:hypothetical protein